MEESRYTLNGGLLILKPDTIAMVATDGHRLALAETTQKLAGLNGEVKVLIPKKAMDEVEKLSSAAGSDAQLDFAKDESHLFRCGSWGCGRVRGGSPSRRCGRGCG
jgi:DNA polymerase-3 subunit beta